MAINRMFVIGNLLLITTMSYLMVDTTYSVIKSQFDTVEIEAPKIRETGQKRIKRNKVASYYNAIKKRNIFNSSANVKKPDEESIDVGGLKETELKLKLWGTVTGEKDKAYAVITELKNRKEQDLYRIGDSIQNATVKMILREKVVLSINGEDEILTMEEKKNASKGTRGGTSRPTSISGMTPSADSQTVNIDRADIEDSLQNINELMRQIKIRPHFSNGQPDGLALSSIKRNSIFKEMGLRNGDIITGVDGTPIESVDDALKFYENISSASSLSLQIKRRGKPKNIDFNIN